jgi:hypothetical protein
MSTLPLTSGGLGGLGVLPVLNRGVGEHDFATLGESGDNGHVGPAGTGALGA